MLVRINTIYDDRKSHLETSISSDVHLGVNKRAILLQPFEGVSRVTMHLMEAVWSATVGEEYHDLVDGFRVLTEVILQEWLSTTAGYGVCMVTMRGLPRTHRHP